MMAYDDVSTTSSTQYVRVYEYTGRGSSTSGYFSTTSTPTWTIILPPIPQYAPPDVTDMCGQMAAVAEPFVRIYPPHYEMAPPPFARPVIAPGHARVAAPRRATERRHRSSVRRFVGAA